MVGPIVGSGLQPLALRREEELSPIEQLREAERREVTSPANLGRETPATSSGGGVVEPVSVQGVSVQGISIAQQVEEADLESRVVDHAQVEDTRDQNAASREEIFDARGDQFVTAEREEALEDAAELQTRLEARRELEDAVADSIQETQAQATVAAIAQGAAAQQFAAVQGLLAGNEAPRPEGEGPGRVTPVTAVDAVDVQV
jgi:hypothetical protein